jgi:hypothetical protein
MIIATMAKVSNLDDFPIYLRIFTRFSQVSKDNCFKLIYFLKKRKRKKNIGSVMNMRIVLNEIKE